MQDIWWLTSYELLGGTGYSSCLPTSFTPTSSFYYSPGLYCPEGYSTACSSTYGSETIVTCCPTSFSCGGDGPFGYSWESTLGCTSAVSSSGLHTVLVATGTEVHPEGPGAGVNAYSVQNRFQASDLITSTSSSSSSSSSSTSTPTPSANTATVTITSTSTSSSSTSSSSTSSSSTSSSSTSSTTATSSPSHDSGFSTSAKAGIAVGVVLGVALIAAIVFLAWAIGKRSNKQNNQQHTGGYHLPWSKTPDTVVYGSASQEPGNYAGAQPPYELGHGQYAPHELPELR
ncbi:hypothetical protein BU16DRAFT_343304 [Lophium mytilinum]|uniref:Uncharacterized protein n=1 Tax=Lophium mytilinum TaxID=390894 RepID=A0A6A6QWR9_9PEZI|nr:hypothetical protein BU16DRAFT_343304 [Lophium mytilinum]